MSDDELEAAGVPSDLVRLSCGIESYRDLIADIENALNKI
jgi:O-acetylhomoserine (thiol)-lyase